MQSPVYDVIGIGIGPFNLGLAALATDIPSLSCLFVEQQPVFNWHPGLLLPHARMQVPWYADLVTLVNPQSRFSYLSFLHAQQRLLRFGIYENPYPLRREYNAYCQWVAGQLPFLRFGQLCVGVRYEGTEKGYGVRVLDGTTGALSVFHGKHLVIGTGTVPSLPACVRLIKHPAIFHASDYLYKKNSLKALDRITLIGSGQSAAEIFQDLLVNGGAGKQLAWFTRSPRFFPMEYSKLTLEMTSADYIDYFYGLYPSAKKHLIRQQDALYKGINASLIADIYDELYCQQLDNPALPHRLTTNCVLQQVQVDGTGTIHLHCRETQQRKEFCHTTQALILATGYQYDIPAFLELVKDRVRWTDDGHYAIQRNYAVDDDHTVFVQNAELHSHGFNSADLGMGPYRNAVILNAILGYRHFSVEQQGPFQSFGKTDFTKP